MKVTEFFYKTGSKSSVHSFSSIVGPSLMGKTQFAFMLARLHPVFYVNFSGETLEQEVYRAFRNISRNLISLLKDDSSSLFKEGMPHKENLAHLDLAWLSTSRNIKLKTVGFLWELVKYSLDFDFTSGADWFIYYLKARDIVFEPMSINEYYTEMEKLLKNLPQGKTFNPPIVFMDEFNDVFLTAEIKLLRNLSRILALSSVLASTNAKVNTLFETGSSSAPNPDAVWVHAIRKLPKASLKAILHALGWDKYNLNIVDFDMTLLLDDLQIIHDVDAEVARLKNLFCLMKEQSKTCLQGVALIVFKGFKEKLSGQSLRPLNVKEIWEHIVRDLNIKLEARKAAAFKNDGPYHSLAMLSNCQVISDNNLMDLDESERPVPTSEIVMETINKHYYFFGDIDDPVVMPFKNSGGDLVISEHPHTNCSHFNLFKDDVFLCMALWSRIISNSRLTVASIVSRYSVTLSNAKKNKAALRNDSCSQECMVYWAFCNSTHSEVSSRIPCPQFLVKLVGNIQIDNPTLQMVLKLLKNQATQTTVQPFSLTLDSVPNLKRFLTRIEIPYLVPKEIITKDVIKKLGGLCEFGICNRLPNNSGLDIQFELKFDTLLTHGYIECKYHDSPLSDLEAKEYINKAKARGSPFSLLVSFSLYEELRRENYFAKKRIQPVRAAATAKKVKVEQFEEGIGEPEGDTKETIKATGHSTKKVEIDRMSIYSIFYDESSMKIVPLLEHDDPEGVFIIIQTNFRLPKI